MESVHGTTPTPPDQLAAQLEQPNAQAIWTRAVEVFGDQGKAQNWMSTPRDIFGGRSPENLVATGNVAAQRRVLEILIRIDYCVFS